jgi:thermitase
LRVKTMGVGDGRLQGYTFVAALLWAVLLLILAPGSKGEPAPQPGVDDDPEGAPYVAGELLVAYEPGTSEEAEKTVVRRSGARTLENLPGEVRLVSFPAIRRESSEAVRERALARALGYLGRKAEVEAVEYNYLREPYFIPNDPMLGNQLGLISTRFRGAWSDAKGSTAKVAIVDSGIYSEHPDIGRIIAQRDFAEGDAVADDDYGHGTHVTGIAGALTDNGKGVAGGCLDCGLLIAKVMGPIGFTTDSRIVKGINWSVNQGAKDGGQPRVRPGRGRGGGGRQRGDECAAVPGGLFEGDRRERHYRGWQARPFLQPRGLGGPGGAGDGHTLHQHVGRLRKDERN